MANNYTGNPITLDTFSSAIDLGDILFGDSNASFWIEHIEWEEPNSVGDAATIYDGGRERIIFNETCSVAKQSLQKKFGGVVRGIYIGAGGVSSGSISIFLSTYI